LCSNVQDDDGDGQVDCQDTDCANAGFCHGVQPSTHLEICDNNIDDNNNGLVDCDDHWCKQTAPRCAAPTPAPAPAPTPAAPGKAAPGAPPGFELVEEEEEDLDDEERAKLAAEQCEDSPVGVTCQACQCVFDESPEDCGPADDDSDLPGPEPKIGAIGMYMGSTEEPAAKGEEKQRGKTGERAIGAGEPAETPSPQPMGPTDLPTGAQLADVPIGDFVPPTPMPGSPGEDKPEVVDSEEAEKTQEIHDKGEFVTIFIPQIDPEGDEPLDLTKYYVEITNEPTSPEDMSTPFVTDVYPKDEEENVPITASVFLSFSKPMDASKVEKIKIMDNERVPIAGTYLVKGSNNMIEFKPKKKLKPFARHFIYVPSTFTDQKGNALNQNRDKENPSKGLDPIKAFASSFVAGSGPGLQVAYASPMPGITVLADSNIQVVFSAQVDPSTITDDTLVVTGGEGERIPGTIEVTNNDGVAEFTPVEPLPPVVTVWVGGKIYGSDETRPLFDQIAETKAQDPYSFTFYTLGDVTPEQAEEASYTRS
jgi:hypothetical protein